MVNIKGYKRFCSNYFDPFMLFCFTLHCESTMSHDCNRSVAELVKYSFKNATSQIVVSDFNNNHDLSN